MTIEERSKIVQDIVKKYPEPDKEYCPKASIYWRGKNKDEGDYTRVYYPNTGLLTSHSSKDDKHRNQWGSYYYNTPNYGNDEYVTSSTRKELLACFAKYHAEYDCLEIGLVGIPANRGKQGEIRNWSFTDAWKTNRVFVFYGQPEIFRADGTLYLPDEMGKYYHKGFVTLLKMYSQQGNESNITKREFNKFSRNAKTHSGSWERSTDYIWGFIEWYKVMTPRATSKNSQKIASMKIENLDKYVNDKYPVTCTVTGKRSCDREYKNDKVMIFRKTADNEGIFRYYSSDIEYDDNNEAYYVLSEKSRILIDKNGKPTFLERNGIDDWKISSCSVTDRVRGTKVIKDGWEQMSEVNHLKYIKDMVDDQSKTLNAQNSNYYYNCNNFNEMGLIVDVLRHPILEKLYKSGYKELSLAIRGTGKIAASIKEAFNGKDNKTGSLKELLGLNNYQLKKLETICAGSTRDNRYSGKYYDINNIIPMIKQITGMENISSLSNESTDRYFNAAYAINNVTHNWRHTFLYDVNEDGQPRRIWYWRRADKDTALTNEQRKHMERVIRLGSKNPDAYRLFSDSVGSLCGLDNEHRPNIDLYEIDSCEELVHVHDALNELLMQQRIEERALWDKQEAERYKILEERMKKLQEHRIDVYEEIGDDFAVVVPRLLSDLVKEGTALSHCVGGYVNRYATGDTNILFIRRKDALDKPFYTMQVDSGHCIQIHGFANRWLGNNPEVIPFIKKWLEDRNIRYEKRQLLDKATGYCASGDLVDGAAYGL